jgi:nucleotide-binding universal stress UspA family protein
MAIKDLMVHLDGFDRSELRLAIGCDLAQRLGAHLMAIHTADTGSPSYAPGEDPLGRHAERRYFDRVRKAGVEATWQVGTTAESVTDAACYADLTIVGQWDPKNSAANDTDNVPEAVLLTSGRPLLVVPYTGNFATVGRRVLIAWKKSREAVRAVNDALPILALAETITLLTINPTQEKSDEQDSAQNMAKHLARHGVKAAVERAILKDIPDATVLLNSASDFAADLIVAGGYSHSRVREMAFGGVTRTLLTEMIAPVLLSH